MVPIKNTLLRTLLMTTLVVNAPVQQALSTDSDDLKVVTVGWSNNKMLLGMTLGAIGGMWLMDKWYKSEGITKDRISNLTHMLKFVRGQRNAVMQKITSERTQHTLALQAAQISGFQGQIAALQPLAEMGARFGHAAAGGFERMAQGGGAGAPFAEGIRRQSTGPIISEANDADDALALRPHGNAGQQDAGFATGLGAGSLHMHPGFSTFATSIPAPFPTRGQEDQVVRRANGVMSHEAIAALLRGNQQ